MELPSENKRNRRRIWAAAGIGLIVLSGCEDGQNFSPFKPQSDSNISTEPTGAPRANGQPRDVEAPELFETTDMGLWDGRPSLGGIWVAHPDVTTPQRVIIRNTANSKSVIGALFRRERVNPGPAIQVSSEAAGPLGMLAGASAELSVVALKREEVAPEPPEPEVVPEVVPEPVPEPAPVEEATAIEPAAAPVEPPKPAQAEPAKPATEASAATTGAIEQSELDPVANAAAALDEVDDTTTAAAPAKPKLFAIQKPFIQAGSFSEEESAKNAASTLQGIGMHPEIKQQDSEGTSLWRVLVGPASSRAERREMLKNIKGIGFDDAFFVTQ